MSGLYFEALSNKGDGDVYIYTGTGTPLDITAAIDPLLNSEGGGAGAVGLYGDEPTDGDGGTDLFASNGVLYFNGWNNGEQELYAYNKITQSLQVFNPTIWGSGIDPEDFTAYNTTVYFVGTAGNGYRKLYATNGTSTGTAKVSDAWVDDGQMAVFDSRLFFDGRSLTSTPEGYVTGTPDLLRYNPLNGNFVDISHGVVGSVNGLNPQDMVTALSEGGLTPNPETLLFMAGTDGAGYQNIFVYDGTTLTQIKGGAATGLDPLDITANQTDFVVSGFTFIKAGVFFSGIDTSGKRGLFFAEGQETQNIGVPNTNVASEIGQSSGLDPYDITSLNGNVYFTGNDSHGRGLYEYNGTTSTLSEVIASTTLNLGDHYEPTWGDGSPSTLAVFNGELYFSASNPNKAGAASVDQLYAYSGSGAAPTQFMTNSSLNSNPNPLDLV